MRVRVTKDKVSIVNNDYIVNQGEYQVNHCEFEFTEEYTEELVKKAVFDDGNVEIEMVIANNECDIPYEVLNSEAVELRVFAYEVSNNELILRYSPTPTKFFLRDGSYKGASSEIITPSQFEQYEQALHDGLVEVNRINVDAEKVDDITTITITKKDGTIKEVEILDGVDGKDGKDGSSGKTPDISIGNVTTVESYQEAEVTITGTDEEPILNFKLPRGEKGTSGTNGQDGFSPTASVSKSGNVATIIITDKNGTTTTTITDGSNYDDTEIRQEIADLQDEIEQIDLTDYVKNNDYASSNKGGVIKTGNGFNVNSNGIASASNWTYSDYQILNNTCFIGKGTLENAIVGKDLANKTYVNTQIASAIGDINSVLATLTSVEDL